MGVHSPPLQEISEIRCIGYGVWAGAPGGLAGLEIGPYWVSRASQMIENDTENVFFFIDPDFRYPRCSFEVYSSLLLAIFVIRCIAWGVWGGSRWPRRIGIGHVLALGGIEKATKCEGKRLVVLDGGSGGLPVASAD